MTLDTPSVPPPPFRWQESQLRATKDKHGHVWFVAKDVCHALELSNTARALHRLDADMKGVTTVNTPGGKQVVATVSEPGLYALAFRSRKPEAKAFQRWVTNDVLPAVRADGVYFLGEEKLLSSATEQELQARIEELRGISLAALTAKTKRGLDAIEEREARRHALNILSKGRSTKPNSRRGRL